MRNGFTRKWGSTIFGTPSAERSVFYWRESSIFLQINQVTEGCSVSVFFEIYIYIFNFVIFTFPYSQLFQKTLKIQIQHAWNPTHTLPPLPLHLFEKFPWHHSFPSAAEWLPCHPSCPLESPSHLLPFTYPVGGFSFWLAFWTCLILLCPRPDPLPRLIYSLWQQLPGSPLVSSLHPSSIPRPQGCHTIHCSTAGRAPTRRQLLVSQRVAWKLLNELQGKLTSNP